MNKELAKLVMGVAKEMQVCKKSEVFKQISKKKNVSKKEFDAVIDELMEEQWLVSIYGSDSTFAITQKGLKELKKI
ncbi:MAG: hypothetical protein N3D75_04655 [Candidatus Aenigmarchaeota archaeon]|nr:hypothetical protein [Candidatus Aenigmarchaeota archaeon]